MMEHFTKLMREGVTWYRSLKKKNTEIKFDPYIWGS